MRNAYSYIRMSTEKQLKGDSLRRQLEASERYAETHGLRLVDHIENQKLQDIGVSGFNGENSRKGVLARFLQALSDGLIPTNSVLLVESLDRLSRDKLTGALSQFLSILEQGIEIVTLADQQSYTKEKLNHQSGAIFVSLGIMLRANEESEMKSKRIGAAWQNKRNNAESKPMTAKCPSWLRLNKNTNSFEVIKEKADIVKKIFELCANSFGYYAIAQYLNENEYPVMGKAKYWRVSFVSAVVSNRSVMGELQTMKYSDGKRVPMGPVIRDYYPAIVSEKEFNLARDAVNKRKASGVGRKGNSFTNIFSGLLYCGMCGERMMLRNRGANRPINFECSRKHEKSTCDMPEWSMTMLESVVLRHLGDVDFSLLQGDENKSKIILLSEEVNNLELVISDLERKMERTLTFVQNNDLSTQTNAKLLSEITALEISIDERNKKLMDFKTELAACEESSRQIDSSKLKEVLIDLNNNSDCFEYRARFNNALRISINKIVLIKQRYKFVPWEMDNASHEVVSFRSLLSSRKNVSLSKILEQKKFEKHCELFSRRVSVKYKNGASTLVDIGTGYFFRSNSGFAGGVKSINVVC